MTTCPCTLLQNALDDLITQFHITLDYLNTKHDFLPLEKQVKTSDPSVNPDSFHQFKETQYSLSKTLIKKIQSIEKLIDTLPGVFETETQQLTRLAKLEMELKDINEKKLDFLKEKEKLINELDHIIQIFSIQRHKIMILTDL
ncbi:hypothetical protein PCANB_000645 [Pneumocystis canis]|nr:hypothetical protein PCK1_000699 [Pneumocystis canis]KAG5437608.1 hypothetical protein PCANB_000645 [Pneumocystis canis]